jgi:Right handed beta helix region
MRTWLAVHSLFLLLRTLLMLSSAAVPLFVPVESVLAAGSPPSVNAGADAVLTFPAKDLTLFGHATDPENDPLTVMWTIASGAAAVRFSAPTALTTTATFTTTGTYVLQLAANDGTSTVTRTVQVTVKPASSQTAFYVDPTYTGATENGSASAPWKSFQDGNANQTAQWNAINSALATNDVIIYFSARTADLDTAEQILGTSGPGSVIRVNRTDTSTHRLTLDGMSKYNTNDATPNWVDYIGSNRMRLSMRGGCCFSIGWDDNVQRDYITIRGFEATGSGARIRWGGSYSVLEYMWVHDVTSLGATVQFNAAVTDYPQCKDLGKNHAITLRNNLIERGIGEGIYIAGTYNFTQYGGCPSYGNTHSDILIEGNTIRDPGMNGTQGDGIDLKMGLLNVTVRNNVIQNTHVPTGSGEAANGIAALGVFSPAKTNYLIEGNRISGATTNGMSLSSQNGTVIRNNVIYSFPGTGIYLAGDPTLPNYNVEVYNNTIYGGATGVGTGDTHRVTLRNNLLFGAVGGGVGGGNEIGGYNTTGIDSDYNLLAPMGSGFAEGPHSIIRTSTTGIVVDLPTDDFHLVSTSPAKDMGVSLAPTGFSTDFGGLFRPQGTAWDIGAYEFGTSKLAPPQNLYIVGGN